MNNVVWFLIAQVGADPLSGGAGWVGAGLLGLVLAWLMLRHLPDKDKQFNDLIRHFDSVIEKKDRQIDGQRAEFVGTLSQMMGAFKSEASAERVACEKHFETLASSMNAAFRTLGDQLAKQSEAAAEHGRRNQQWIDVLKREIEERRAEHRRPDPPG